MGRIFVTGGSGFVGRNLIAALRARGDEVVALVRSDAAAATVKVAGGNPVHGELDDVAAMAAAMAGCSVVFHCAAKIDEWGDPREFERINVRGTEAVIAAAKKAGVARLVHVSTEAVLIGGGPMRGVDETRPLPRRAIGSYARTKGLAETRVRAANGEGLTTIVVRPRFVWGKGDTAVLPRVIEAVKNGRFLWISGGRYATSTCHVQNLVEGMLLAAEKGEGGEVYFLTDGAPVEFRAFLTAMLQTQGVDPGAKSLPFWLVHGLALAGSGIYAALGIHRTPPMPHATVHLIGEEVTVVDAKARRELGYVGKVTQEEGLRELLTSAQPSRMLGNPRAAR
ncbi:MAG: NAD-dependent epimerase/dehydratase family protein [Polyangiales bacterium]